MVIQKVHGIHATGMSLHERFSILATAAPDRVAMRQRRRSLVNQNLNYSNRLLEQVARQLQQQQAKRQALRQRLGIPQPGLRRFGSEGSLAGLKRSNSFGNLSQQSVKNRVAWRQSNFNLSRSSSFNNLNNFAWYGRGLRGFRKRGGVQRALRGRFRAGRQGVFRGPQQRLGLQQRRGLPQRGRRTGQRRAQQAQQPQQQQAQQQRPQVARRGATRGRGRGGITRSQSQSRLLSKEELDAQLDQYMSCTKAALDQQLDNYMKSAMELD